MQLFAFTFAILAICSADRLERTYLPPAGANTAGGSDGALSGPSGSSFAGHHNQSPHGSQPQAFEPQTYSTRPQSSGSQSQSFEPQTYSARPQSSPGSQTQSFRPQSQSFGPQSQSGPNGPPNANSNFGPSNSRYQPTNERPQSNYQQNSQVPQYSQGSDFGPDSSSSGRGTFNGSPNPNINYDTPNNDYQSGNGNSNGNYQTKSQRPQASAEANAAILRSESNIDGDSFSYSYETENGISADESGIATNGVQAQGSYSYTGDDGQLYSITYTADENGYRPVGDHLPTPPPIPDAILRSIEENARAAAANPGGNYGDQSNSDDNQNYNGIGSSTGSQNRPSGNRYQGSSQGPSEDESTGYGPPTNRSPAHQQLNRQQTYNNNGPRDFEAPNGNGNNNQYNSPSRPAGQSRFPGGQPQTYTNDAYKNGPQQDSYDANTQQGPAETGYPSGRPSNQGFTGVSNDQQSGQRRPPASFNPDSGYKY